MKYMITWNERPQGTAIEYENAQRANSGGLQPVESTRQF
jgi:hypothetical protein